MKKRNYILFFVMITIIIILADIIFLERALTRDLLSKHIREGMENTQVIALIGMPARDVGSGAVIHEYPLLFDKYFYVVYGSDCKTVASTHYPEVANPLQGFILPLILLSVAGVEAAVYFALRRHPKKN